MLNFNKFYTDLTAPRRYALAFLIFVVALFVRAVMLPVQSGMAFITFYPAIVIAFYLCGLWPGSLTVLLSAAAGYYIYFKPYFTFTYTPEAAHTTLAFLISAAIIGYIVTRTHHDSNLALLHQQQLADSRLAESENFLQLAMDAAHLGAWRRYIATGKVIWSDICLQFIGYPPGTVINRDSFLAAVHPDDRESLKQATSYALKNHTEYQHEYRILWPDGSIHWISAVARTHYLPDGTPEYMEGVLSDITQRKQLELEAAAHARDLHLLAESMPQIVWTTAPDGNVIHFNQKWVEYTGRSMEESYGINWTKSIHPDDLPGTLQTWQSAIANKTIAGAEYRLRRADGEYRWFLVRAVPSLDEHGNVYKWFGTCTDIHNLKLVQEELLASKLKLQSALSSMGDAVVIADRDGNLIQFNGSLVKLLGYNDMNDISLDVNNRPNIIDILSTDGKELPFDQWPVERALRGETGNSIEFILRRKDTGASWRTSINFAPLHDEHSNVTGAVATIRDITEIREMEQALLNMNAELDAKVKARTEELDRANKALMNLSRHDTLTGLANRLAANERLRVDFVSMRRSGRPYAVLMLDIDHFKNVNDTFGHSVGDQVLQNIAETISNTLRESDFAARFGGEEFLILLPATDLDAAAHVAEKIRNAVAATPDRVAGTITVSIGIAMATPRQKHEDEAVDMADKCLYAAKRAGRNRVVTRSNSTPEETASFSI